MKLSTTQQRILDLMSNGWELGENLGCNYYGRIQKGGLGKGGEVITVSFSTISALEKRGLIKAKSGTHRTRAFELLGGK